MNRVYLDNNATTPLDPQVLRVMMEVAEDTFGNPSSIHWYGQEAAQRLNSARRTLAHCLGIRSNEIIFTSGGTEALHLGIKGIVGTRPTGQIITSNVEHSAAEGIFSRLEDSGIEIVRLPAGLHGAITSDALTAAITSETRLIVLIGVNNETGVMTDISAIAAVAAQHGIPLVIDGVALLGKAPFIIPEGVTVMTFSAHKFHGPKGAGFAFVRRGTKLQPQMVGGAQEGGRRAGTENLPAIVAMVEAVRLASKTIDASTKKMSQLRDYFEENIIDLCGGVSVNGEGPRVSNTTSLAFEGVDGESLLMSLDLEGVASSHGSACSAGALEPSRVLLNMGYSQKHAKRSIRFSLSRFTTQEEISHAIKVVVAVVDRLRKYSHVHH